MLIFAAMLHAAAFAAAVTLMIFRHDAFRLMLPCYARPRRRLRYFFSLFFAADVMLMLLADAADYASMA